MFHAREFAYRLQIIPGLRVSTAAMEALADALADFCEDAERTDWLVREAVATMRKWGGVPDLRDMYAAKFHPVVPNADAILAAPEPAPEPVCESCKGFGLVGRRHEAIFCSCPVGEKLKAENPRFIEVLNAETKRIGENKT